MFYGTVIESLLEKLDASPLILSGVNTHACIRTAAINAYQRDFEVVVRDCVASRDAKHHEITLDYMHGGIDDVISLNDVKRAFC